MNRRRRVRKIKTILELDNSMLRVVVLLLKEVILMLRSLVLG